MWRRSSWAAGDGDDVVQAAVRGRPPAPGSSGRAAAHQGLQLGQVLQLGGIVGQQALAALSNWPSSSRCGGAQRAEIGVGAGQEIAAQAAFRIGAPAGSRTAAGSATRSAWAWRAWPPSARRRLWTRLTPLSIRISTQTDAQQGLVQRQAADRPELGVGTEIHPGVPFTQRRCPSDYRPREIACSSIGLRVRGMWRMDDAHYSRAHVPKAAAHAAAPALLSRAGCSSWRNRSGRCSTAGPFFP